MLVQPPLEALLPKVDNRYILAMLVAKRTRQLVDGARPLADSESGNMVTLACEEIGHNRVKFVHGLVTPAVPLRPEIEAARRQQAEEARQKRDEELIEEARVQQEQENAARIARAASAAQETPAFDKLDVQDITEQFLRIVGEQDQAAHERELEIQRIADAITENERNREAEANSDDD